MTRTAYSSTDLPHRGVFCKVARPLLASPPMRRASLLILLWISAGSALAGPKERLAELQAKTAKLTPAEVSELVGIAATDGADNASVDLRYRAIELLSSQTLTAADGDKLAERLRPGKGEAEDFVRVRIPALVSASGTRNFTTHLLLARQIAAGGSRTLMRNTLAALRELKPTDETVADLLAATAMNPNQRMETRKGALRVLRRVPGTAGLARTPLEGFVMHALAVPELRKWAIAVLRDRPLSAEVHAQLVGIARGNDSQAAAAREILQTPPPFLSPPPPAPFRGHFAGIEECNGVFAGMMFRRALVPAATPR